MSNIAVDLFQAVALIRAVKAWNYLAMYLSGKDFRLAHEMHD